MVLLQWHNTTCCTPTTGPLIHAIFKKKKQQDEKHPNDSKYRDYEFMKFILSSLSLNWDLNGPNCGVIRLTMARHACNLA